ncbi:hypothetical protein PoB_001286400 [Plakobranchus ocellatus]|uniref:Fibronectin type-III domain-containing protein n=1 Tax=Plakobranchus ocellatus TaxID=259542 RepID=A0AAV3YWC4_9GAST|nr:hypothetical protein PoB_001286400 [Plakobranchus ocellatus]
MRPLFGLFILCCMAGTLSLAAEAETTCNYSTSTLASDVRFRMCVRVRSASSLEAMWSTNKGSRVKGLGQVKNWILTISESFDRRRVVSALTLEPRMSRYVVRKLQPDTKYFVFLDSVDESGWYVTMIAQPIAIRTLTLEESRRKRGKRKKSGNGENKSTSTKVPPATHMTHAVTSSSSSGVSALSSKTSSPSEILTTKARQSHRSTRDSSGSLTPVINLRVLSTADPVEPGRGITTEEIRTKTSKEGEDLDPEADVENQSSKGRERGDAGRRLVWWVLVGTGCGLCLILVLSAITVFTHKRQKRSASLRCPHIEQELSQSSRTSTKVNNVVATSETGNSTNNINTSNNNNFRIISENGYARSVSSTRSRPLPPVAEKPSGNSSRSAQPDVNLRNDDKMQGQTEEGGSNVYAEVSDFLTPDPGRIISMISWGSEFDILDEPEDSIYNNLAEPRSLDQVNSNLDTTYSNISPTTVVPSQPPPLPSSATATASASVSVSENLQNQLYSRVSKPGLAKRQASTSSMPRFVAPLPPSGTPDLSLPRSLLSGQHRDVAPSSQQQQLATTSPAPSTSPLDLPKEQLQQLVLLLLSQAQISKDVINSSSGGGSGGVGGGGDSATGNDQPTTPTYLIPAQHSLLARPQK